MSRVSTKWKSPKDPTSKKARKSRTKEIGRRHPPKAVPWKRAPNLVKLPPVAKPESREKARLEKPVSRPREPHPCANAADVFRIAARVACAADGRADRVEIARADDLRCAEKRGLSRSARRIVQVAIAPVATASDPSRVRSSRSSATC